MIRPGLNPTLLVPLLSLVLAACGPSTSVPPPAQPTPGTTPAALPSATVAATSDATPAASSGMTTVRAYFILGSHTDDSGLVPVLRVVPATGVPGTAAMSALLAGPNARELAADPAMYSWIPTGVKLLDLTITGGVATVRLSSEFGSGPDDAQAGQYAQVVFTLTQFPSVTSVVVDIDGIATGAPIVPAVRADFTKFLPAIWVDGPAWGATVGHPLRVQGLANVFEGQFRIELLDAAGQPLIDVPVSATCGTGCWGTFDTTISYALATGQSGTLRVYDLSAKDGKREHVVDYPVSLTP